MENWNSELWVLLRVGLFTGLDVISGKSKALTKARHYPRAKTIDVKII